MKVIPFVHEGLGNSSYLVQTTPDTALLVDPDRSVGRYLREAENLGVRIEAVFETHLHADFATGAVELAHDPGARVFAPAEGQLNYRHQVLNPGDHVDLDGLMVEAIGSPGHTPEHLSYALRTAGGLPVLFSGGSLLVGGAARTDLIAPDLTERLTRDLYRTLHGAFDSLPDETALYPTHGGGSFCSTSSSRDRTSTLGEQRKNNPLLAFDDEEEFVRWFPATFPAAPAYFFRMRAFNQQGPRLRSEIPSPEALSAEEFDRVRSKSLVVDVRSMEPYSAGHIPGSLNITFRSSYPTWLGWLVPEGTPLLFVLGDADLDAVVDETLLVGYETFAGYLAGDIEEWTSAGFEIARTDLIDAAEAANSIRDGTIALDVREQSEFMGDHIEGAVHIPLGELSDRISQLPVGQPILAYCGHGERSSSAVSILERAGHGRLLNLAGGLPAWRKHEQRIRV